MEKDTAHLLIMQNEESDLKFNNEIEDFIQMMLCSHLEVVNLEFINQFSSSQINKNLSLIMFVWGTDSKVWSERQDTKVLIECFIEHLYKRTFVNITLRQDTYIPEWARQLQLFDLTMNSSIKTLSLFLKQDPQLTSVVTKREHREINIPYKEAMRVINLVERIDSNILISLIPSDYSRGKDEKYKFKSNKNLTWYLLFLGIIKDNNPIDSLISYIPEIKDITNHDETNTNAHPDICWAEQPKANGYRFRYECEGSTHGGLPGEDSNKNNKSVPAIMVNNYKGKIIIIGYLIAEDSQSQNVNRLMGKEVYNGVLITEATITQSSQRVDINHIFIQHCKKKQYQQSIELQLRMRLLCERVGVKSILGVLVDKKQTKELQEGIITELEDTHLQVNDCNQIEEDSKEMSLCSNVSSARLLLKVYIGHDSDQSSKLLTTLISHTIYGSQVANSTQPKISKLNIYSGVYNGGDEMIILCEKIQKQDMQIIFYELPSNDVNDAWSQTIEIGSHNLHCQYAISINTPPYKEAIEEPKKVYIRLKRKSDRSSSQPLEFVYKPQDNDPEKIGFKRQKHEVDV